MAKKKKARKSTENTVTERKKMVWRSVLSDEEVHARVAKALAETGLVTQRQWTRNKTKVGPVSLSWLYRLVKNRKRNYRPFMGYGDWYAYLEQRHGVTAPVETRLRVKKELSFEELKQWIRKVIEQTYEEGKPIVSASDWCDNSRVVFGRSLNALYEHARQWRVGGKGFGGHGAWHVFLQKELGITPVRHQPWSDERLHRTIALLAEKHSPDKVNWNRSEELVLHRRSLRTLYALACERAVKIKGPWFGHGSFAAYVEWAKKNYGTGSKYEKEARKK